MFYKEQPDIKEESLDINNVGRVLSLFLKAILLRFNSYKVHKSSMYS